MTEAQRLSKLTAQNKALHAGAQRDRHCIWLLVRQLGGMAQITLEDIRETADNHLLEGEWITPEVMQFKAVTKIPTGGVDIPLPKTR